MSKHNYRQFRGWDNLEKGIYVGDGEYDIPFIDGTETIDDVPEFVDFGTARAMRGDTSNNGVHFYVDDYRFECVWNRPDAYLSMLRRFKYVISPDFSVYSDFPKAMQIYNHYRKHYLARYWQDNGITVIPDICWSGEASYDYCFDGEPKNSVVATSTVSMMKERGDADVFKRGWHEMITRLHPTKILVYGTKIPEGLEEADKIVLLGSFQSRLHKLTAKKKAERESEKAQLETEKVQD